jgi:hypothetical protein
MMVASQLKIAADTCIRHFIILYFVVYDVQTREIAAFVDGVQQIVDKVKRRNIVVKRLLTFIGAKNLVFDCYDYDDYERL